MHMSHAAQRVVVLLPERIGHWCVPEAYLHMPCPVSTNASTEATWSHVAQVGITIQLQQQTQLTP